MLKSVEGVFRDGKVELKEIPPDIAQARVLVTFLPAEGPIDLRAFGISEGRAAQMRWGWGAAVEDWDDPAMDVYNDYETR
jgi:hypothetical protein